MLKWTKKEQPKLVTTNAAVALSKADSERSGLENFFIPKYLISSNLVEQDCRVSGEIAVGNAWEHVRSQALAIDF